MEQLHEGELFYSKPFQSKSFHMTVSIAFMNYILGLNTITPVINVTSNLFWMKSVSFSSRFQSMCKGYYFLAFCTDIVQQN